MSYLVSNLCKKNKFLLFTTKSSFIKQSIGFRVCVQETYFDIRSIYKILLLQILDVSIDLIVILYIYFIIRTYIEYANYNFQCVKNALLFWRNWGLALLLFYCDETDIRNGLLSLCLRTEIAKELRAYIYIIRNVSKHAHLHLYMKYIVWMSQKVK